MNNKIPSESKTIMEQMVMPNDTNMLNTLFGGRLLQWMDTAGAMAAIKHSRQAVVTVSIDRVDFKHPIRAGEMVKLIAQVTWTGRTSMEVKINVFAENPKTGSTVLSNEAYMTFVAVDGDGKPSQVPKLIPETDEEKTEHCNAQRRREKRIGNPCGGDAE